MSEKNEVIGKSLFSLFQNYSTQILLGLNLTSDIFRGKENILSELADDKTKITKFISISFLILIMLSLSTFAFICEFSFPIFWPLIRIFVWFSEHPLQSLWIPLLHLATTYLLIGFLVRQYSEMIQKHLASNDKKSIRLMVIATALIVVSIGLLAVIFSIAATLGIIYFLRISYVSSDAIGIFSVLGGLFVFFWVARAVSAFLFKQIRNILGFIDLEIIADLKRGTSKFVYFVFSISIVSSATLSGILQASSSKGLTEANKKMLDAKKYPITVTTNYCALIDDKVICSMTLLPTQFQDYTLYGNWHIRIEKGFDKTGNISVVHSSVWVPKISTEEKLPTAKLVANRPSDLEVTSSKTDACKLFQASATPQTGISVEVNGRSDEYGIPRPLKVRLRPNNEEVFKDLLRPICAT